MLLLINFTKIYLKRDYDIKVGYLALRIDLKQKS